jgi:hypothetical protein
MLVTIDNRQSRIQWEAADWLSRTIQNAKNLLMTRQGEVPYDRYRGLDPAVFEVPIGYLKKVILQEIIRLMLWEPDVQVTNATADIQDGTLYLTATLEIDTEGGMEVYA